ncbi:hypothetical protein GCWU000325_00311 [Alloprevotella tannerae ATCC 51259]|uniref:Uncharacterized protein n=1 Tax=Alloprevotella tannerae ATCC 51259 TaxID=626522 RepID=C9LDP0_9BACT|nr:hypothetical protein GCWU000325_00311 [Alloprevotella tannerae ATCC 51259]
MPHLAPARNAPFLVNPALGRVHTASVRIALSARNSCIQRLKALILVGFHRKVVSLP